jgi:hypothetical protein
MFIYILIGSRCFANACVRPQSNSFVRPFSSTLPEGGTTAPCETYAKHVAPTRTRQPPERQAQPKPLHINKELQTTFGSTNGARNGSRSGAALLPLILSSLNRKHRGTPFGARNRPRNQDRARPRIPNHALHNFDPSEPFPA